MTRFEQIAQAQADARERAIAAAQFDAYWRTKAREVEARERAEREAIERGRSEIVSHLLRPGALEAMNRARLHVEVDASEPLPAEILWAPCGEHHLPGKPGPKYQVVDEIGAIAVEISRIELDLQGKQPAIDFEHYADQSAGKILAFSWDPTRGIIAKVEWTPAGQLALRDRLFCAFSPEYLQDGVTGRIKGLVAGRPGGALTNEPAFGKVMMLWAADGRRRAAQLVRETLITAGHSADQANAVASAIRRGADGAAVALMIQSLSRT